MTTDRNGLDVLSRDECLLLLASRCVGRVGLSVDALPVVLPTTYRLVADRIVFRTAAGSKLRAATGGVVVAFEVDDVDPFSHGGWSVLVTGVARPVVDPSGLAEVRDAGVPRWAPAGDDRVVAIDTQVISGRRLGRPS